jgi:hypothetical protein
LKKCLQLQRLKWPALVALKLREGASNVRFDIFGLARPTREPAHQSPTLPSE